MYFKQMAVLPFWGPGIALFPSVSLILTLPPFRMSSVSHSPHSLIATELPSTGYPLSQVDISGFM